MHRPVGARRLLGTLDMLELLKSLSLEIGAIFVAVACSTCAIAWARIDLSLMRWGLILVTPAVLAYSLYWAPVWLGTDPSEYWSWAPIFYGAWFLAGLIPSLLIVYLLRRTAKTKYMVPHV